MRVNIFDTRTFAELSTIIQNKRRVWCLITAWLPEIRHSYEDKTLYSESPGQIELYEYVKKHFTLQKVFSSRFPVAVYVLAKDHGDGSNHRDD
jgi:hypothetical protein